MLSSVLVPINRAGWPFIAIFAAVTVVLAAISMPLGAIGIVLTAWCTYFFRDPARTTPLREGLVISPADGVVQSVGMVTPPAELGLDEGDWNRVSIFMNVFDVHVNRIPASGRVTGLAYRPGKFFNASLDKASEHNERQSVRIATAAGPVIGVVQIAGLVARRIKCDLHDNQTVDVGARFGLIRFGSRLDVFLPAKVPVLAIVGQCAVAGETVIADFMAEEPMRTGKTG